MSNLVPQCILTFTHARKSAAEHLASLQEHNLSRLCTFMACWLLHWL